MDYEARDTIERFHEAFNRRDLDALGDLITDDCVFEATSPAPDGTRHVARFLRRLASLAFRGGGDVRRG
jgi:ketosteroid isomerase-like protein